MEYISKYSNQSIQIASALNVDLQWDSVQRYWYPKTDVFGRTNMNNIYMTGDAAFVYGGEASMRKLRVK